MANPYDVFFDSPPKGKTALLANAQDVLAMPMFHDGLTDVNVTDPAVITKAKDDVAAIAQKAGGLSYDHVDYTDLPAGKTWLHQSWSGNVSDAVVFLANKSDADNLSYYWPGTDGHPANVDNDTTVLLKSGKNPVLAHLLADWVLDAKQSLANFTNTTGYQMPVNSMTPESMVSSGIVPEHLSTVIVSDGGLRQGLARAGAGSGRGRALAIGVRRAHRGCLARRAAAATRPRYLAGPRGAGHDLPAAVLRVPVLRRPGDHVRHRSIRSCASRCRRGTRRRGTRRSSRFTFSNIMHTDGLYQAAFVHTFVFVGLATLLCLLIGYPIAYFLARRAGRYKAAFLALFFAPFWISYMLRMLAWRSLLPDDGYVNRVLIGLHVIATPYPFLQGKPLTLILGLVYGYVPFMILPLYATLDRIPESLLEAGRDLGLSPARTFWHVTLPQSYQAILAGLVICILPMFGDYYTQQLLAGTGEHPHDRQRDRRRADAADLRAAGRRADPGDAGAADPADPVLPAEHEPARDGAGAMSATGTLTDRPTRRASPRVAREPMGRDAVPVGRRDRLRRVVAASGG